jgi:hypothetical protein
MSDRGVWLPPPRSEGDQNRDDYKRNSQGHETFSRAHCCARIRPLQGQIGPQISADAMRSVFHRFPHFFRLKSLGERYIPKLARLGFRRCGASHMACTNEKSRQSLLSSNVLHSSKPSYWSQYFGMPEIVRSAETASILAMQELTPPLPHHRVKPEHPLPVFVHLAQPSE